jgi:ABC-type dipeptide/oligopeptide/nickel transport system permease component
VGTVLFYAGFIVVFNLMVDLVLIRMNPKLRYE